MTNLVKLRTVKFAMHCTCTLIVRFQSSKDVSITFSPPIEVSLACYQCRRAFRTILLNDSAPAAHFGPPTDYDGHPFEGKIMSFNSDVVSGSDDFNMVTANYGLEYEFQTFTDAKYPERTVAPQPTWARVRFTATCQCGCNKELSTQSNLGRPFQIRCRCGRVLKAEQEQSILFSNALLR